MMGSQIETFPVRFPNGLTWQGTVYRGVTRATGRRVVVRSRAGDVLLDTLECNSLGDASARLRGWLAEVGKLVRPAPVTVPDGTVRESVTAA